MTRKEYMAQWRALNREHLAEWYQANKKKRQEQMAKWREKNADAIHAKNREYKKENAALTKLNQVRHLQKQRVLSAVDTLKTEIEKYFDL